MPKLFTEKLLASTLQLEQFLHTPAGRTITLLLLAYLLTYGDLQDTHAQNDTIPDPSVTLNFQLASSQNYVAGQAEIIAASHPATMTVAIPDTDDGGLATFSATDTYTATLQGQSTFTYASILALVNQAAIEHASVAYQRQIIPGSPAGGIEETQASLGIIPETPETTGHALTLSTLLRGSATAIQLIRQENGFHFLQVSSWASQGKLSVADSTELTQNIAYAGQATSSLFFDFTDQTSEQNSASLKLQIGQALPIEIAGKQMQLFIDAVDLTATPATCAGRLVVPDTDMVYTFTGADANSNQVISVGELSFSLVTSEKNILFLPLINR